MSKPTVTYAPRPDATPEGELDALANIYAYILRCAEARRAEEKKKVTRPGGPDDAEEPKNDRTAEPDYSR
jgi:hypothetical protein